MFFSIKKAPKIWSAKRNKILVNTPGGINHMNIIPQILKNEKRWGAYKFKPRPNGKLGKIPYNPKTHEQGNQNKPETWLTYDEAKYYYKLNNYEGLGLYISDDLCFLDIDNIRDQINNFENYIDLENNIVYQALKLTNNSYCEVSVSGNGIHIFFKGKRTYSQTRNNNIELYTKNRFCAVTEDSFYFDSNVERLTPREVRRLERWCNLTGSREIARESLTKDELFNKYRNPKIDNYSDKEILKVLFSIGKDKELFKRLYSGTINPEDYDWSELDYCFLKQLAFITGKDAKRMDTIFRKSPLYRTKYNQRLKNTTYGLYTMNKAIKAVSDIYHNFSY